MSEILKEIKRLRTEKGFSQEYVASQLDIERVSYALIESGKRKLSIDRLYKIAAILDTDVTLLIQKNPTILSDYKVPNLPLKNQVQESEVEYYRSELTNRLKLEAEIEVLKNENELLRNAIEDKDKIIKLLERNKSK